MPKMILIFVALVSVQLAAELGKAAEPLKMPEQFVSESAAVILGLENETELSDEKIRKASRRLFSKYHPDRYSDPAKYSDADRQTATMIAQQIQKARDLLLKYVESNPNYSPKTEASARPGSASGFSQPNEGSTRGYSWSDAFSDQGFNERQSNSSRWGNGSSSVVTDHYYGSSLRGTMFEFLYQYPGAKQIFMPLEGVSTKMNYDVDLLLIINPAIFPKIEIKVLSKNREGVAPQFLETIFATYIRGRHLGNSGHNLSDGIELPNGNYLWYLYDYLKEKLPVHVHSIDSDGSRVMLSAKSSKMSFMEMNRDGYNVNGVNFVATSKEPFEYLPASSKMSEEKRRALPEWKKIKVDENTSIIRLGYTPSVVTCERLFQ